MDLSEIPTSYYRGQLQKYRYVYHSNSATVELFDALPVGWRLLQITSSSHQEQNEIVDDTIAAKKSFVDDLLLLVGMPLSKGTVQVLLYENSHNEESSASSCMTISGFRIFIDTRLGSRIRINRGNVAAME